MGLRDKRGVRGNTRDIDLRVCRKGQFGKPWSNQFSSDRDEFNMSVRLPSENVEEAVGCIRLDFTGEVEAGNILINEGVVSLEIVLKCIGLNKMF
uniref:Unnamed protein product n=1 Tax=Macaca fascicularis TaxID=9541 RepID=Q9N042_MACFA|nr:unnamed protein product [Macaca fascicularis]